MKLKKVALIIIILIALLSLSTYCHHDNGITHNYRQDMQDFVIAISQYSKSLKPDFIIIPQNGLGLLQSEGQPNKAYLEAIDGFGQEPYMYGNDEENELRPADEITDIRQELSVLLEADKKLLLTDYTDQNSAIKAETEQPTIKQAIHFFGHLNLSSIPTGVQSQYVAFNNGAVKSLADATNFLYLINPEEYPEIENLIADVGKTDYDLIIVDAFDNDGEPLTKEMVAQLKQKQSGAKRLVIAYMSIGEAEDYRYYFPQDDEESAWLDEENPEWEGNYRVKYWEKDWQNIIYGSSDSYLDQIIDQGFDGVYLDTIDSIKRLVIIIDNQQLKPSKMAVPPVLISLIKLVFRPIAAIAIVIKNLLNNFVLCTKLVGSVITVASSAAIKNRIKNLGTNLNRLNVGFSAVRPIFI